MFPSKRLALSQRNFTFLLIPFQNEEDEEEEDDDEEMRNPETRPKDEVEEDDEGEDTGVPVRAVRVRVTLCRVDMGVRGGGRGKGRKG